MTNDPGLMQIGTRNSLLPKFATSRSFTPLSGPIFLTLGLNGDIVCVAQGTTHEGDARRLRSRQRDRMEAAGGPFTRNGDEVWTDIIAWLHYGLIEAEELGVTAGNADEMAKSTSVPAIQRLLGSSGELGSRLGLDNKWLVQAIKAGGNYAEIFERNVGQASPLKLNRGLNATWNKGGLMYAIPFK